MKCLSVLLVALSLIFLVNFAIISLLTGVEPSVTCYWQRSGSSYHNIYYNSGVNFWEGLWIPIPSFVTGIIGKEYFLFTIFYFDVVFCRTEHCLRAGASGPGKGEAATPPDPMEQ